MSTLPGACTVIPARYMSARYMSARYMSAHYMSTLWRLPSPSPPTRSCRGSTSYTTAIQCADPSAQRYDLTVLQPVGEGNKPPHGRPHVSSCLGTVVAARNFNATSHTESGSCSLPHRREIARDAR